MTSNSNRYNSLSSNYSTNSGNSNPSTPKPLSETSDAASRCAVGEKKHVTILQPKQHNQPFAHRSSRSVDVPRVSILLNTTATVQAQKNPSNDSQFSSSMHLCPSQIQYFSQQQVPPSNTYILKDSTTLRPPILLPSTNPAAIERDRLSRFIAPVITSSTASNRINQSKHVISPQPPRALSSSYTTQRSNAQDINLISASPPETSKSLSSTEQRYLPLSSLVPHVPFVKNNNKNNNKQQDYPTPSTNLRSKNNQTQLAVPASKPTIKSSVQVGLVTANPSPKTKHAAVAITSGMSNHSSLLSSQHSTQVVMHLPRPQFINSSSRSQMEQDKLSSTSFLELNLEEIAATANHPTRDNSAGLTTQFQVPTNNIALTSNGSSSFNTVQPKPFHVTSQSDIECPHFSQEEAVNEQNQLQETEELLILPGYLNDVKPSQNTIQPKQQNKQPQLFSNSEQTQSEQSINNQQITAQLLHDSTDEFPCLFSTSPDKITIEPAAKGSSVTGHTSHMNRQELFVVVPHSQRSQPGITVVFSPTPSRQYLSRDSIYTGIVRSTDIAFEQCWRDNRIFHPSVIPLESSQPTTFEAENNTVLPSIQPIFLRTESNQQQNSLNQTRSCSAQSNNETNFSNKTPNTPSIRNNNQNALSPAPKLLSPSQQLQIQQESIAAPTGITLSEYDDQQSHYSYKFRSDGQSFHQQQPLEKQQQQYQQQQVLQRQALNNFTSLAHCSEKQPSFNTFYNQNNNSLSSSQRCSPFHQPPSSLSPAAITTSQAKQKQTLFRSSWESPVDIVNRTEIQPNNNGIIQKSGQISSSLDYSRGRKLPYKHLSFSQHFSSNSSNHNNPQNNAWNNTVEPIFVTVKDDNLSSILTSKSPQFAAPSIEITSAQISSIIPLNNPIMGRRTRSTDIGQQQHVQQQQQQQQQILNISHQIPSNAASMQQVGFVESPSANLLSNLAKLSTHLSSRVMQLSSERSRGNKKSKQSNSNKLSEHRKLQPTDAIQITLNLEDRQASLTGKSSTSSPLISPTSLNSSSVMIDERFEEEVEFGHNNKMDTIFQRNGISEQHSQQFERPIIKSKYQRQQQHVQSEGQQQSLPGGLMTNEIQKMILGEINSAMTQETHVSDGTQLTPANQAVANLFDQSIKQYNNQTMVRNSIEATSTSNNESHLRKTTDILSQQQLPEDISEQKSKQQQLKSNQQQQLPHRYFSFSPLQHQPLNKQTLNQINNNNNNNNQQLQQQQNRKSVVQNRSSLNSSIDQFEEAGSQLSFSKGSRSDSNYSSNGGSSSMMTATNQNSHMHPVVLRPNHEKNLQIDSDVKKQLQIFSSRKSYSITSNYLYKSNLQSPFSNAAEALSFPDDKLSTGKNTSSEYLFKYDKVSGSLQPILLNSVGARFPQMLKQGKENILSNNNVQQLDMSMKSKTSKQKSTAATAALNLSQLSPTNDSKNSSFSTPGSAGLYTSVLQKYSKLLNKKPKGSIDSNTSKSKPSSSSMSFASSKNSMKRKSNYTFSNE